MSATDAVLTQLRLATASRHQALEEDLNVIERLGSPPDRRALVARYYGMHAAADFALQTWLGSMRDLDYSARRRTPLLLRDLAALGLAVPPLADGPAITVSSQAEALGLLYVLEGSTLGGRVIRKTLAAQGIDDLGLSFLDPYGAETGNRWKQFLAVLDRDGAHDVDGVIRGGLAGFANARLCLTQLEPVA
jgi:heme oxygenase